VGSVPKLKAHFFPERHMGLVPHQEREQATHAVAYARQMVEAYINLDDIRRISENAPDLGSHPQQPVQAISDVSSEVEKQLRPRIGFIEDRSFWFYYPENLEQLKHLGAELVQIDAMASPRLPDLDALYIGGGFPETQADALADNKTFRADLKSAIENGLPVYAECGGFMYLGERLVVGETAYPMVGALPLEFGLQKRPQGHGYTVLEVARKNIFYPVGKILRGHEFHYSKAVPISKEPLEFVFRVARGRGINGDQDGISKKNLLACYTHIHAAGERSWAKGLFRAAARQKKTHISSKNGKRIFDNRKNSIYS
jgi:cobyrinic acid a,c-diamide synthase